MLDELVNINTGDRAVQAREIVNGEVACVADRDENDYVSGRARVVVKNEEKIVGLDEFQPGEILVTQMTDPSMEEQMAKAAAFITDKGGQTSHAAIISREMNRFCIIGTDSATGRIKTGDMLYMSYRQPSLGKMEFDGYACREDEK